MGDRHIALERYQLQGNTGIFDIVEQRLAAFFLFDFSRMSQHAFKRTKVIHQLSGRFRPNTGNTRNIINAVAGKRLNIHHLIRINTKFFLYVFRREKFIFHRIIKLNPGADQLHQILIAGDNDHFQPGFQRLSSIGGDQIVRLITLHFQIIEVQSLDRLADNGKLRDQILRRFLAGTFIIRKNVIAEILPSGIKQNQTIVTADLGGEAQKHIGKAVNGVNRGTVGRCQRRQAVKSSENISGTVNQTDFFGHNKNSLSRHRVNKTEQI